LHGKAPICFHPCFSKISHKHRTYNSYNWYVFCSSNCNTFLAELIDPMIELLHFGNQISFEILRSVHVSIRGSRSPFYRKELEVVDDFGLSAKATRVFKFFKF
jgi:hypothetical protein